MSIPIERLVTETLAKSGLLWIRSDAGQAPVWHANVDGMAYVVSGEGEQFCPPHTGRVEVIARSKESRARLLSFEADVETVVPDADDWEAATAALKAGRLNAPGDDVVARWAESARVMRIRPDLATVVLRGETLSAPPPPQDAASDAEPAPAPSPDAADAPPGPAKVSE